MLKPSIRSMIRPPTREPEADPYASESIPDGSDFGDLTRFQNTASLMRRAGGPAIPTEGPVIAKTNPMTGAWADWFDRLRAATDGPLMMRGGASAPGSTQLRGTRSGVLQAQASNATPQSRTPTAPPTLRTPTRQGVHAPPTYPISARAQPPPSSDDSYGYVARGPLGPYTPGLIGESAAAQPAMPPSLAELSRLLKGKR